MLKEGVTAISKAAKFINEKESCRVVCTAGNGSAVVSGTAPMQWHFTNDGYSLPPMPDASTCQQMKGGQHGAAHGAPAPQRQGQAKKGSGGH